jgi:hypothetical protein
MSLLTFCEWVQASPSSIFLRESTWGFPVLGAVHVLGIAWFGGIVLVADLRRLGFRMLPEIGRQFFAWKAIGLAVMLLSGATLFWLEPLKCFHSLSFRAKLALLILVGLNAILPLRPRLSAGLSLMLWIAVIFASQGIAFL